MKCSIWNETIKTWQLKSHLLEFYELFYLSVHKLYKSWFLSVPKERMNLKNTTETNTVKLRLLPDLGRARKCLMKSHNKDYYQVSSKFTTLLIYSSSWPSYLSFQTSSLLHQHQVVLFLNFFLDWRIKMCSIDHKDELKRWLKNKNVSKDHKSELRNKYFFLIWIETQTCG